MTSEYGQRALSLAVLVTCLLGGRANSAEQQPAEFPRPVLIKIEGMITPLLEQFLYRKLDQAQQQQAELIILEIDSPGGFVDTTIKISDRLRELGWAKTVAYIPREAISGAAIISLACDDIVMAPHARLGDAGEIVLAEDNAFRYVPEKQRSFLVRHIRDLASAKDRSPALAEAMVDMDVVVYRVRRIDTGEIAFMSDAELLAEDQPGLWEKEKLVYDSREKHFLTVNGEEAVDLRLAVGTATNRESLKERYPFSSSLQVLERTAVDNIVVILNWRFVTGLLFVVGLIALYIELSAPGVGVGGGIASLCFALFFWSRFLGGTADWLEVILFVIGVFFVLVELFVIPGFGVAGISGLLLMVASVVMASQHFVIPSSDLEMNTALGTLVVVATSGLVSLLAAFGLSHYFGSIPVISWLALETPPPSSNESGGRRVPAAARFEGIQVGDKGLTESPLRPAGQAKFEAGSVDVVSDGSFVDVGIEVRVIEISGNRVVVREVDEDALLP